MSLAAAALRRAPEATMLGKADLQWSFNAIGMVTLEAGSKGGYPPW